MTEHAPEITRRNPDPNDRQPKERISNSPYIENRAHSNKKNSLRERLISFPLEIHSPRENYLFLIFSTIAVEKLFPTSPKF